jgi:hypothetical protein
MTLEDELAAIDAIRQLKARYFRHLDAKEWDDLRMVFTDDAVFDLRAGASVDPADGSPESAETADLELVGRAAIVDAIRRSINDRISVHHGHCHEVAIRSEGEADGVIAMVDKISNRETGACVIEGWGHYHERYRCENGVWRIWRSRLSRLVIYANLAAR